MPEKQTAHGWTSANRIPCEKGSFMSARNGDRSRFGRRRKEKVLRRANNMKLREELLLKRTTATAVTTATPNSK